LAVVVVVLAAVLATAQVVALVVMATALAVVVTALAHVLNLALVAAMAAETVRAIPAQHALQIHVQAVQQDHALPNQSLAVNAATLAATKHDSPQSSPFCMESSRFR
jgi:hypothetical protein